KVLEAHGYKVLTASDGKEAVKIFKAKKGEIALVILDILMPKMNGEEACSEIKKIDPFAKVLISTGYIDSESAKAAIQQCDNKYVEKPFHIQELLYAIRANINLQKKK
ncbi:MAG: response regulator, partial [Candidatus Firestonebacteria bacterium]